MSKLFALKSKHGAQKRRKRVGRGNASGHGTYSCRGMNGQNSRTGGGTKPGFEGGQTPLYRKMPKLKGFKNINRINFQVVNVGNLNIFDENEEIDIAKLYDKKLISNKDNPVKLLGEGELTKALKIKIDKASKSAVEKVVSAKGEVTQLMPEKAPEKQES
jgi:large subunit ribosomal protein L15